LEKTLTTTRRNERISVEHLLDASFLGKKSRIIFIFFAGTPLFCENAHSTTFKFPLFHRLLSCTLPSSQMKGEK
jgi:hypothetical protein